ncbi:Methyltransferase domain-containing protein [Bradyrhizobium lablabi]|uniref:Methyltransferase domain-containing protein n=1 Tax=Bradyrhizobium lablabi TaxID=722472 RepID=A0A1M7BFZ5_9BRAD|nr:class I SAM-dependent methyltransferase [Bradyrhizobium lablabi]SHL53910.1 Methyltransferase domain-containing protein [Bradyrhizobium lablabi]
MSSLRPAACPISGETQSRLVFSYDAPPSGEIGFRRPPGEPYHREVWQFVRSNHFVSRHAMTVQTDYGGDYVNATYGNDAGLRAAFERVIALPPERSDNAGRIARIRSFAASHFGAEKNVRLLDVGAGLGVFPYAVKQAGWQCTAIDPDERAVAHMRAGVGVDAMLGDFMSLDAAGQFEIVTFNKVLEHVQDPVGMLRRARQFVAPGGFVYLELPDGEAAAEAGEGREEFFVEHLHIFSFVSIAMLADRAGFRPIVVERLQEPSTKFTLRAFLVPSSR